VCGHRSVTSLVPRDGPFGSGHQLTGGPLPHPLLGTVWYILTDVELRTTWHAPKRRQRTAGAPTGYVYFTADLTGIGNRSEQS